MIKFEINNLKAYHSNYFEAVENPEAFWATIAKENFTWKRPWTSVLDWDFSIPKVSWFEGAQLNITENCIDRHLEVNGNKTAILFEPNDPNNPSEAISYNELHKRVNQFANVLKSKGIQKGDRICIYLPMIPELAISVLACARIGAIHSVVFAGFSASALSTRINDCDCKMVITSDGGYRGAKTIDLKSIVDTALLDCTGIKSVLVAKRINSDISMVSGRDFWLQPLLDDASEVCEATVMDAEDPLFILYTSGSTGQPKGMVHSTAGYMVYSAYTFKNIFQYNPEDVYWCTADIGWITGHSYIVYGPLLNGATTLMFEGVPSYPDYGRFWSIVEKHKVTQFYTAPTAIRALAKQGLEVVKPYDLSSLKILGTVGEPINEEAWHWYHDHIGKGKCPLVDTWWQTETGGIMISPLAGITPNKPAHASLPLPGIQPILVDAEGNQLKGNNVEGNLCIKFPWPSMLRTTYGDHKRCKDTYFSTYPGLYFTGDGAKRDHDGYLRILGRVDDVINVSGHRMGTAEVENAINEHPKVIESAVVGFPHDIKGQGIYAYAICDREGHTDEELIQEIKDTVRKIIGPIAKPDEVQIVPGLPKTRSGKIMRRILRKVASKDISNLGDTSTLLNPEIVDQIINGAGIKNY